MNIQSTITFKDGSTFPTIAVFSRNELVQGAYREVFEIRLDPNQINEEAFKAAVTVENLEKIVLTETDTDENKITGQFTHRNFQIIIGDGHKFVPDNYVFLTVAQRSEMELSVEQLSKDYEDLTVGLIEVASLVAGEEE